MKSRRIEITAIVAVAFALIAATLIRGQQSVAANRRIKHNVVSGGTSPGTGSLIAWYDFNDATDSHGSYDLSAQNSPAYTTDADGTYGTSGNGSGAAHWQQTSLDDDFADVDVDCAYVIRVRPKTGMASADTLGINSNTQRFKLEYNTGANGIRGNIATSGVVNSTVVPSDGTWYVVVVSRNSAAGTTSISVNGAAFVSASIAFNASNGTAFIGAASATDAEPCDIDYIGCFNSTLTADNVTFFNTRTTVEHGDL